MTSVCSTQLAHPCTPVPLYPRTPPPPASLSLSFSPPVLFADAGIYISMLMGQIMSRGGADNLVGAAIGNGCTGTEVGICNFGSPLRAKAVADYYFGGGFYSNKLRAKITAVRRRSVGRSRGFGALHRGSVLLSIFLVSARR